MKQTNCKYTNHNQVRLLCNSQILQTKVMGYLTSLLLCVSATLLCHVDCQPLEQITSGCENKVMDIYFILDSSSSIWDNHYNKLHPFVQDVVSRLDIGENKTRVGVLVFSNRVNNQPEPLRLNRFYTKADITNYINLNNFPYLEGITNTFDAIRYVRENQDFRQGVTKVMVVVTDGGSSNPDLTAREANLARDEDFYVFVIGVGQYTDEEEWNALADDPDRDFVYNVTTFEFTDTLKNWLTRRACSLPPKPIGGVCSVNEETYASLYFISGSGTALNSAYLYSNLFAKRTRGDSRHINVGFFFQNCNRPNVPFGRADDYCSRSSPSSQTSLSTLISNTTSAGNRDRQRRGDHNQIAVIVLGDADDRAVGQQDIEQLQEYDIEVILIDLSIDGVDGSIRQALSIPNNYVGCIGQDQITKSLIERTCIALNRQLEHFDFEPV